MLFREKYCKPRSLWEGSGGLHYDFYFLTDCQRSIDGLQLNGTATGARFTVEQNSSCDGEKDRSRLLLLLQLTVTFGRLGQVIG